MGLFDKVKNLFTEEIEEEKPIRKEVRQVEIVQPRKVEEPKQEIKSQVVETKEAPKEDKFVFFDDKDFDDLEKETPKVVKKEEVKPAYKGVKPYTKEVVEKKVFKPSPIISPIYGVLDKNYKKDDIISKPVQPRTSYYSESKLTIDDVRNRAFSTLEDDLKNELLEHDYVKSKREVVEDDLNMFSDIEEIEETYDLEQVTRVKKNEMLFDDEIDEETEFLAKKLEEQRKKLDEISSIIGQTDDEPKSRTTKIEIKKTKKITLDEVLEKAENKEEKAVTNQIDEAFEDAFEDIDEAIEGSNQVEDEEISEVELFDLIDSMYEKKDDEE